MSSIEQIIPRPALPGKPYKSPEQHWEEVVRDIYQDASIPSNVEFKHDIKWDRRFWSLQNAYDQNDGKRFGFWTIIGILFFLAQLVGWWMFGRLLR